MVHFLLLGQPLRLPYFPHSLVRVLVRCVLLDVFVGNVKSEWKGGENPAPPDVLKKAQAVLCVRGKYKIDQSGRTICVFMFVFMFIAIRHDTKFQGPRPPAVKAAALLVPLPRSRSFCRDSDPYAPHDRLIMGKKINLRKRRKKQVRQLASHQPDIANGLSNYLFRLLDRARPSGLLYPSLPRLHRPTPLSPSKRTSTSTLPSKSRAPFELDKSGLCSHGPE
ncbi:hypothetical protein EJ02DRAFT_230495 [Clathrospora elynae]|uniref:Uncharacterized protein n=1 Tax=Clathrospora elynae TaxID=706981 RepID=A0A6A5SKZ5_9PLEO|nr:hypothetical protein EJ02DRAFT_230495 [Clathrospora elynae]